jgi:hypothetical protein
MSDPCVACYFTYRIVIISSFDVVRMILLSCCRISVLINGNENLTTHRPMKPNRDTKVKSQAKRRRQKTTSTKNEHNTFNDVIVLHAKSSFPDYHDDIARSDATPCVCDTREYESLFLIGLVIIVDNKTEKTRRYNYCSVRSFRYVKEMIDCILTSRCFDKNHKK